MWPRLCTLRERRAHQSIDNQIMLLPTLQQFFNMCDVWFHIPLWRTTLLLPSRASIANHTEAHMDGSQI